ncbi:MAG: autotransporter domain-containing protein [Candidatus Omnitrophica bacterium]|nr:autotransporter domain-containing protein [Candidatus Omnitrophota bacterium]MDD5487894.1 autotransporter domain-containing protein [Candidatus Omnitrophota bacterium]
MYGVCKKTLSLFLSLALGVVLCPADVFAVAATHIGVGATVDPAANDAAYVFDGATGALVFRAGNTTVGNDAGKSIDAAVANTCTVAFYNTTGDITVTGTIGETNAINSSTIDLMQNHTIYFQGDVWMPIGLWNSTTIDLASGVDITGDIANQQASNTTTDLVLHGTNVITGGVGTGGSAVLRTITVDGTGCSITGDTLTENVALAGNTLDVGGIYDQTPAAAGTLSTTVASATSYGHIDVTGDATIDTNTTVSVNVTGYVKTGSALTIVDGNDGGTNGVAADIPVTDNSTILSFTSASAAGDNLVITAATDYVSPAAGSNDAAVAKTLASIDTAGATGDMATVVSELQGLTSATAVDSAYSDLMPAVDDGARSATYDIGVGATQTIVSHMSSIGGGTGVSTGSAEEPNTIWAKGFGNYTDQDKRKGIDGYKSWMMGVVVGYDCLMTEALNIGVGFGYAYSKVDSKQQNVNDTDINCVQGLVYGQYNTPDAVFVDNDNVYADLVGLFGWNWYKGSRDINFGAISRTAEAEYDGQQYQVYGEIGYDYPYEGFIFTPFTSLSWVHLRLDDYTEDGAGSLNLNVDGQEYDKFEQGLGLKAAYPFLWDKVNMKPEVYFKWLHDYMGEQVEVNSAFAGGGPSFTANGSKPDRNTYDVGLSLTAEYLSTTVELGYDLALKDEYISHNGTVTVKYSF